MHAIATNGRNAPHNTMVNLLEDLISRGLKFDCIDNFGRLPLHYAVIHRFDYLINQIL
jgi:hypothetical protein